MEFKEKLKQARIEKGLTQTELAEKICVLQKDISRWENGIRTPNTQNLILICKILEVSADELLGLK